jgi:hypothetical protein
VDGRNALNHSVLVCSYSRSSSITFWSQDLEYKYYKMHKDVEMLELLKLPRGQCWPVWEDTSLWGFYLVTFRKLKPVSWELWKSQYQNRAKRVRCCCGICFLIVTCMSELLRKAYVEFQLGSHPEIWYPNFGNSKEFVVVGEYNPFFVTFLSELLGKVLWGCCYGSYFCVRPKWPTKKVWKMLIQKSLQKYFYVEVSFIGGSDK